ncbi:MAG: aldo/keto reductase [Armatimonadota bacterium]|nr:MAG: aldo/keto reductase [Armatimonadota bacterium]
MERRTLGKTGLEVAALGFGAIKLPKVDEEEATRALNRALDLGINFVDTARNYRDSERKIGQALKHRRGEYVLATKTVARDARGLRADLETSLRELDTDHVDLYQFHSVSDLDSWAKVMAPGGALEEARKAQQEGLVRHIGITMHRAVHEMEQAIESGAFETIMVAYNPLDPERVEPRVLPLAQEHDMGVIIMKPLSGGTLSLPAEQKQPGARDPIVAGSLRYILSNSAVTVVIPGIETAAQVEENAAAIEESPRFSDQERGEFIETLGRLRQSYRYGQTCLRCGYCLPCSQEIEIPEVFRALHMAREYPDELKHLGVELYESLEVKASACVECEECLEKCPAGLPIPDRLKDAVAQFE